MTPIFHVIFFHCHEPAIHHRFLGRLSMIMHQKNWHFPLHVVTKASPRQIWRLLKEQKRCEDRIKNYSQINSVPASIDWLIDQNDMSHRYDWLMIDWSKWHIPSLWLIDWLIENNVFRHFDWWIDWLIDWVLWNEANSKWNLSDQKSGWFEIEITSDGS